MEIDSTSQQQFQELKAQIRQKLPTAPAELAGSFSAFCQWFAGVDDTLMQKVDRIAMNVRLWRDSQDVLRQLWEQIY